MDTKLIRVLLIEDDEDDYCLVRDIFSDIKRWQYDLEWVSTCEAGLEAICRQEYDVCLLDYRLGDGTGLDLLRETTRCGCKMPIILLTGEGDHKVDVEAMNAGAADFLIKGQIDAAGLERSIRYAITRRRAEEELAATVDELQRFNRSMMGREERMIELKREVNEMARKAGLAPPYDTALVESGQGGPDDA